MQSMTRIASKLFGDNASKEETHELFTPRISRSRGSDHIFHMGIFDRGLVVTEGFRGFGDALSGTSDLQMKYRPLGMVATLVALLAAVVLYAGWCGGTSGAVRGLQFGLLIGVPASTQFPTLSP